MTDEERKQQVREELWKRMEVRSDWIETAISSGCDVLALTIRAELQLLTALEKDFELIWAKET